MTTNIKFKNGMQISKISKLSDDIYGREIFQIVSEYFEGDINMISGWYNQADPYYGNKTVNDLIRTKKAKTVWKLVIKEKEQRIKEGSWPYKNNLLYLLD